MDSDTIVAQPAGAVDWYFNGLLGIAGESAQ